MSAVHVSTRPEAAGASPNGRDHNRPPPSGTTLARPAGFLADLWSVTIRSLRALPKEPELLIPSPIVPVFFFAVNIGALQDFAQRGIPVLDDRAFQLPSAIIFAVTGVSRAHAVVTDIPSGYFDRLLMTPIRRLPLLLGMMAADFVQIIILSIPVILLGMLVGVRFETGLLGLLLFLLLCSYPVSGVWPSSGSPTRWRSRPPPPEWSTPASSSSYPSSF